MGMELSYGVMVTQLVLVQSFKVRILIGQHRKTRKSNKTNDLRVFLLILLKLYSNIFQYGIKKDATLM